MISDPSTAEVSARLLAHLRNMQGMNSVEFSEPPSRISGGFETLIFAFRLAHAIPRFEGPLILRLFREADAAPRALFEAAVNTAMVKRGYPAPAVLDWSPDASVLGGAFLILVRLPGENLLARIVSPALFRFPAILAQAQLALHALDPAPVLHTILAAGFSAERLHPDAEIEEIGERALALDLRGLEPGVAWLRAQRPHAPETAVVCHGDFHPLNVLVSAGRVSGVVDWTLRHMKLAAPAYDVGATLVLLSHPPVELPWALRGAARHLRKRLVRAYLAHYRAQRVLDPQVLVYYEALRLLGCLLEAGEHRLADLGCVPRPAKPTTFGSPRVQRGMLARFREISGVALALPADTNRGAIRLSSGSF